MSVAVFALMQLLGDPSLVLLPPDATEANRAAFRAAYGLDEAFYVQYWRYLGRVVQGDFGTSMSYHEPALNVFLHRLPATLQLSVAAITLAILISIPSGIISAVKRNSIYSYVSMTFVLLGQSVATFWLGMILILIFAVNLRMFPVSGYGTLMHLVLPTITLAAWLLALLARMTRSELLDVLGHDYVRTARAKGLNERVVIRKHALMNALIPIVTVIGLQFGQLFGGAIMTEVVFAWPGIGTLVMDSIFQRDYAVVLVSLSMVATISIVINLFVDILYAYIDPRIKY
jgi:ABC-type dipeptide/oligopeptide/nickel transport system permease component